MKRLIYNAVALTMPLALSSCFQEELQTDPSGIRDGYIAIRFSADVPAMQEVVTRAVDPDGGGVQDMTLFCFDSYGLFTSTVTAQIASTSDLTGTFSADVPENTRIIHFVANQNMSDFAEDDFRGKSEAEVMALLEGSSGRMIYWARFACDPVDDTDIAGQMAVEGNSIRMIRNHALVSVDNTGDGSFTVTGFAVCNTNAFGTVAPYHPDSGFDFEWPGEDFVTLPANDAKMSGITDVTTDMSQYVFECENSADDPVSVIIRGHASGETDAEDLYYRVMLVDEDGEQLLVRRNHHYILHIGGELSFGQATFAEALEAAATNNVWISISDEVASVEDADYILTVSQTAYVYGESDTGYQTLTYTLERKNEILITESDEPEVSWIDNNVASQGIDAGFQVDSDGIGRGTIQINIRSLDGNEKQEGTLLVKKGRLQRRIKVIVVKTQSFVPSWVGTQVYGSLDSNDPTQGRAHVTAMFTIPESCPEELFPMRVLISVNELDVRNESGMQLTVVRESDEGYYGEPNDIGYKYLYIAEGPGIQRVYFENILNQDSDYVGTLTIEAEHFETMERTFTFSDTRKSITVSGLNTYSGSNAGGEYAEDEVIYYRLVPQKKGANVQFDLLLTEKDVDEDEGDGTPFNAGGQDEFLLYSQNLSYYLDGDEGKAGVDEFDCTFYPTESDSWWQSNNPSGGRMLMFKPKNPDNQSDRTGRYSIYMYTNRAQSAEVVRIASNLPETPAVLDEDAGGDGKYAGNSYRSAIFELANYNPFRFAARLSVGESIFGNDDTSEETEEIETPVTLTYEPDQEVDIEFDITSFRGSDGKSVDPFGEEFEIYIDAPMLSIDEGRLDECHLDGTKLKTDPSVPGRFVYTVDADRSAEREYGFDGVINEDSTEGVNQSGERKRLPFVTSSIVSAGDIVISSNEEQVVFFTKTFNVTNTPVTGFLRYKDGSVDRPVPQNAFVSFERVRNGSRIGAVTVTAEGEYELRLRKEYEFNWYTDAVELRYTADDGMVYHKTYQNLAELFDTPDIVLEMATE